MIEAPRGNRIDIDPEIVSEHLKVQKIKAGMQGLPEPLVRPFNNIETQVLDGTPPIQLAPLDETVQYGSLFRRFVSFAQGHYYHALNAVINNWGANNKRQGRYAITANGWEGTEARADILLSNGAVVAVVIAEPLAQVVYIPEGTTAEVLAKTATVAWGLNKELQGLRDVLVFSSAPLTPVSAQPRAA